MGDATGWGTGGTTPILSEVEHDIGHMKGFVLMIQLSALPETLVALIRMCHATNQFV